MSLNLNPNPETCGFFFQIIGEKYEYDQSGFPLSNLTYAQREILAASNPVGCATFFDIFIRAFCDVILGMFCFTSEFKN